MKNPQKYLNTLTGQIFKVGSLITWDSTISVAEMSFENENEGQIIGIDYLNKEVVVLMDGKKYIIHNKQFNVIGF
jgi:hypothetical protein